MQKFIKQISFDGYTSVGDMEEYPQFLMCSDDATDIFPADAGNSNTTQRIKTNIFKAFIAFIKKLIAFIKTLSA